jgi:hypothetical protein
MLQKYLFVAISFYHNIVCQNVSCDAGLRPYTHKTFLHTNFDKKIKRHFDKKIFFSSQYCNDISKHLGLSPKKYFQNTQEKILDEKISLSFYRNIFLSKYLEQKCLVCNGPKLATSMGGNVTDKR